jgi:prepilin-type N-terminal cleavage/methylation domain-containing protein
MQKMSKNNSNDPKQTFTLIEIMVVIVIIAILAAMIVPFVKGHFSSSPSATENVRGVSEGNERAVTPIPKGE